jgi:hypothetical protein
MLVVASCVFAVGSAFLLPRSDDLALLAVVLLIFAAEFVNGWTDARNAIATVVGTRSLSPLPRWHGRWVQSHRRHVRHGRRDKESLMPNGVAWPRSAEP